MAKLRGDDDDDDDDSRSKRSKNTSRSRLFAKARAEPLTTRSNNADTSKRPSTRLKRFEMRESGSDCDDCYDDDVDRDATMIENNLNKFVLRFLEYIFFYFLFKWIFFLN